MALPLVLLAVTLRVISTAAAAPRTHRLRVLLPAFATATTPSAAPFPLSPVPPAGVSTTPAGCAGGRPVLLTAEVVEILVLVVVTVPTPATVVSENSRQFREGTREAGGRHGG